jgi:homeodomain-containing protein
MQVRDGELPRARQLARTGKELSRGARVRMDWMDFYGRYQNVARTCRHFGISGQTFYRRQKRYDPHQLATLEEPSHRRRQPTWSPVLAERILALRRQYPRWDKDKLVILLAREQCRVSASWWDTRFAGRRRFGVRRRVRSRMPAARPVPVRAPAPVPQAQRRCRTRQPHPHRGVLPGHPCSLEMKKLNRELRHWEHRPPSPGSSCSGLHLNELDEYGRVQRPAGHFEYVVK